METVPLRPCPFCGLQPTLESLPESNEYVLQHPSADCVGSALFVLAESAEACAQQWNARHYVEYQWQAVLDLVAHLLLSGKPDHARTVLRRAINGDVGSDAQAQADYWHSWLVETPITTQQVAPIVAPDLFSQPA